MFEAELQTYRYLAIFVLAVVEGEAALVGAAWLASRGDLPYFNGLAAAFAGSWLTGEALFYATQYGGRGWFVRKAETHPRMAQAESWVRKRGKLLVFFSRFLWGFRPWIPPACALCGMPGRTFSLFNTVGAAFWVLFFAPICWYFGQSLQAMMASESSNWDVALLAGGVALAIAAVLWIRRRLSQPRGAL
jgi:membrane protein DedA with SNARE-associated domain